MTTSIYSISLANLWLALLFCGTLTTRAQDCPNTPLAPLRQGDKYGFVDREGMFVIPPVYDYVSRFNHDGYAGVRQDGLVGVIDKCGNPVVPIIYDGKWFNTDFRQSLLERNDSLFLVNINGTEVFVDLPTSSQIFDYNRQEFYVFRHGGKCGFITNAGEPIYLYGVDSTAYGFSEGYLPVRVGSKWGYVDTLGNTVIEPTYDIADSFHNGLASVAMFDRGYGVLDTRGNIVIPLRYYDISEFNHGRAIFDVGYKIGIISAEGEVILPAKYLYGGYFSEGLAYLGNNLASKVVDTTGKTIFKSYRIEDVDYFSDGVAVVNTRSEKYGYINAKGKKVTKLEFDFAYEFVNGYGRVEKDGKFGFVDTRGRVVVPIIYDNAGDFKYGLSRVTIGVDEFYIDANGIAFR